MATIRVVWLIDADPPSEIGGGRGFYPATGATAPPDQALMIRRIETMRDIARAEVDGKAVATVHTSPRYRDDLFAEPYRALWLDCAAAGLTLALHPHEDRADGSTMYDDAAHMERVITERMARARALGLPLTAFRSGTFAFNPALPRMLAREGLLLDLSAAPGLAIADRPVDWPRTTALAGPLRLPGEPAGAPSDVFEVPIGWDGMGTSLDANYLFCERLTLERLVAIWAAMRTAAEADGRPRLVNFLAHGFGLDVAQWREQSLRFLDHVRRNGGEIVCARQARAMHEAALARSATAMTPA